MKEVDDILRMFDRPKGASQPRKGASIGELIENMKQNIEAKKEKEQK